MEECQFELNFNFVDNWGLFVLWITVLFRQRPITMSRIGMYTYTHAMQRRFLASQTFLIFFDVVPD